MIDVRCYICILQIYFGILLFADCIDVWWITESGVVSSFRAFIADFIFCRTLLKMSGSERISALKTRLLSIAALSLWSSPLWLSSTSVPPSIITIWVPSSFLYEPNWFGFDACLLGRKCCGTLLAYLELVFQTFFSTYCIFECLCGGFRLGQ